MRVGRLFTAVLKIVAIAWAIVVFAGILVTYGPVAQAHLAPILTGTAVLDVVRVGNKITWRVSTEKTLPCRITDVGFYVRKGVAVSPITVRNVAGEPVGPSASYRPGPLRLGPWIAILPDYFSDAETIESSVYYDCPPHWWLTPESLGTVTVPSP